MNIINPNVEIIEQEDLFKHIELCGRTCYHSSDLITPDSAKKFVNMLIESGHGSVLEHATVYLKIPYHHSDSEDSIIEFYGEIPYARVTYVYDVDEEDNFAYITTNYRVINDYNWYDDLKYLCEPTEYHEKRITVRFTTDIGVSREYNRHRVNSISEESTRYCNYTKERHGEGLNIMTNCDVSEIDVLESVEKWDCHDEYGDLNEDDLFSAMCEEIVHYGGLIDVVDTWIFANLAAQWSYKQLIKLGWKAQQARRVLPLDTKTELVHTAFESDWQHFLSLRSPKYGAKGVHPDAANLADKLYDLLNSKYGKSFKDVL